MNLRVLCLRLLQRSIPVLRNARGATAVEYGMILALIVIVMIVALKGLAGVTVGMWNDVSTKVINAR